MYSLTFLGTGGAWGVPEHSCSCLICASMTAKAEQRSRTVLLWKGSETLLIDCGPDIRSQMKASALTKPPDAVLITHEHGDHYIGLDELLSFRRCVPREAFIPIPLYATREAHSVIENRFGYLLGSVFEKRLVRAGEPLQGLETQVVPFKTYHGSVASGSVGYVIRDAGVKMVYTSDFSCLPEEPDILWRPDLLVLQTYWLNEPAVNRPDHMSLQNAMEYILRWEPRQTLLTHLSDQDCVPGDPANDALKKIPPKNPLPHPQTGKLYPIPLCQEDWDQVVSRIAQDFCLPTRLRVSYDGLRVPCRPAPDVQETGAS